MTSKAEQFGAALGKAFRKTAEIMREEAPATKMYRTNLRDVPKVEGLKRDDGWVDMQVQFLIDKKSAGADHVVGWTVLKPGARHENHRHHNCDEFFIVLKGHGHIYTDEGQTPSGEGDVVYSPRGCWHGFNNTSDQDVVLVWGWMGAGSIEASGYQVHPETHKSSS
jgi:mannose-6-phosphate isomerase-like protein (cupin superfamily)